MKQTGIQNERIKKAICNVFLLLLLVFLISCNRGRPFKETYSHYRGINGNDTADLSITTTKHFFKGDYKIIYGSKAIMDSGYVRGKIVGDTLIGNYYYISYGGQGESRPITLLMRDKKLISGSGALTKWLGFRYFDREVPIDYEAPQFVFEEVQIKPK